MSRARPSGHDIEDRRGSAVARRRRRAWLLSPESGFGGNRRSVPCFHGCGRRVTFASMNVDRHPVCGHDGGSYRRSNVVPSCRPCNINRCDGCKGARRARGGLLDRERLDPWEMGEVA